MAHRSSRMRTANPSPQKNSKACAQVVALIVVAMLFNSWILYVASIQEGICDIDPKFDRIYHIMTVLEITYDRERYKDNLTITSDNLV
ncbi:unnamed protein product [Cylicostephanus goldi]|uniref:Uncharacterized protein n=1 Tax=Cylicostephanus goldi TaxID=71465 RepID=A0A3P7NKZ0_CYLGO|nr:unnamed protein product [Cylicostephanus goldi]